MFTDAQTDKRDMENKVNSEDLLCSSELKQTQLQNLQ